MRKHIISVTLLLGGIIIIFTSFSNQKQSKYYFAFDEQVDLFPKENSLIVKYLDSNEKEKKEFFIKSISNKAKTKWRNSQTLEITTNSETEKANLFTKLKSKKEVITIQEFYTL